MGQSIPFLLATSSPESVTQMFVLERFPVQGCDLATPPDVNNAVTFLMVLLVVRISWRYSTSVFSPPLLPCFLRPSIQCTSHINRKGKQSFQIKKTFFPQTLGRTCTMVTILQRSSRLIRFLSGGDIRSQMLFCQRYVD